MAKKKGRIKSGKALFVANAGEYYVMAELLKQDAVAALAPRNTPSFDILATKEGCTVKIRVKTKSEDVPRWVYSVRSGNPIFRDLSGDDHFTVLVDLTQETKDLKFYIVPTAQIDRWLKKDFEEWVKKPGKKGRPHNPDNPRRHLDVQKRGDELNKYLNHWEILWEK